MGDDSESRPFEPLPAEADAELERAIRRERKFSLEEAIGRMAGPGAMKGASPMTLERQAAAGIENWLRHHMPPGHAELEVVLQRRVLASEVLLRNLEQPLGVLAACCRAALDSEFRLEELVRETDVEW